ncbi:hypothetical protein M408DRAFT_30327 [Serendipita vermifera MAFF 305830]|uniref:Phytocyanin domain-containing protein n=1 Tax=Serendipita vermifera MAFF 305830 TaxID=933852 RepID=A0A0C3AMH0_SERVB|nr:hypothetical protein M408DRAFT_30327 [Serendipita vermifera MAFF 305830]
MHYLSSLSVFASLMMGSYAATIKVQVGMNSTGGLATVFNPNQVTAQVDDTIEFIFMGKNHTVTQSSFAEPCTRQLDTRFDLAGADSGFMPVAANATEIPTWTIKVNDASAPQWFFCNQAQHCNAGMVFAINAPTTGEKTFEAFLAKAANATHPDPALNVTAPFTPPAAAGSSPGDASAPATTNSLASSTTDPLASATDAPANAEPSVSASESGTAGGLSFSSGGTAAADQAPASTSGTALASSPTARNAGARTHSSR